MSDLNKETGRQNVLNVEDHMNDGTKPGMGKGDEGNSEEDLER